MSRELTFPLPDTLTASLIARALAEDLGDAGDLSSMATVPKDLEARAEINSRTFGVASGVEMARRVFRAVDPEIRTETYKGDGFALMPGDTLMLATGSARSLLTAERVALNILGHMSGIATATAQLVEAVEGTGCAIACTRKTLPGLRALQKFAVRCGGGMNHRFGLHDLPAFTFSQKVATSGAPGKRPDMPTMAIPGACSLSFVMNVSLCALCGQRAWLRHADFLFLFRPTGKQRELRPSGSGTNPPD